ARRVHRPVRRGRAAEGSLRGAAEGRPAAGREDRRRRRRPGQGRRTGRVRLMSATDLAPQIGFDDFMKVDVRVGRIIKAEPFPEARKPAYKLTIDFGEAIGVKKSSAQITHHYTLDDLSGRKVAAVVNFPPRQIGPVMSEVLTLGFPDAEGNVVLVGVDRDLPLGGRLF